jgi:hypothetical protein
VSILTVGPVYFPGWVSILFSAGLALGIIHHLPCLFRGPGNRWFHAGHMAMALSMIYMYLSMSYDWNWLPAQWQMWFFVATSVAIAAYLAVTAARRQPVNLLWVLLLIGHLAMIYMWYPMMRWNAILIFVLVSWFAIEAAGWVANLLPDDVRLRENRAWLPYQVGARTRVPAASVATAHSAAPATESPGSALDSGPERPGLGDDCECHTSGHLITSSWKDRALMAVMAVSMGYMFYGMELMGAMSHSMGHMH